MSIDKETDRLPTSPELLQHDYVGSTHAHKCFPKGQRLRKPVANYRTSGSEIGNPGSSLVLMNQRLPLYAERTMHLYLPRLTFDCSKKQTDHLFKTKRTNCSYITNNKFCLRQKGINLHELYSLKHNKRGTYDNKIHGAPIAKVSRAISPISLNITNKTLPIPLDITTIMQSNRSRQNVTGSPMYIRLMRELEREVKIPGHVRSADCTGNTLGKVLTKEHLEDLLKRDKPVIPAAFYMKS